MNRNEFKQEIRKLIGKNKTSEAIEILKRLSIDVDNKEFLDESIILQGRFKQNEKRKRLNLIPNSEYNIELNNINQSVLTSSDEVVSSERITNKKLEKSFREAKTFPQSYLYQLLTIFIFSAILTYVFIDRNITDLNETITEYKNENELLKKDLIELNKLRNNSRLKPLVISMDSPNIPRKNDNVYDIDSRKEGKTNSDDIEDAFNGSRFLLMKEVTGPGWNRTEHIKKFKPDLLLIHYSCFYGKSSKDEEKEFDAFLSTIENFETKILIYSRQDTFKNPELFEEWKFKIKRKYPKLEGKLFAFNQLEKLRDETRPNYGQFYSFRHSATRDFLKRRVNELLPEK